MDKLLTSTKEELKNKYKDKNSYIFFHGKNYLSTAKDACTFLEKHPDNFYPILTLLGLSLELFFKSLDTEDASEKFKNDTLTNYGQPQTVTNNKNGHNLEKLLAYLEKTDPTLYTYLVNQYSEKHQDNLVSIFQYNKNIFPDSRYAYENINKRKYYPELNKILTVAEFLYQTIEELVD